MGASLAAIVTLLGKKIFFQPRTNSIWNILSHEMCNVHSDWFHNTRNLASSEILRNVRGPVIAMTSWATFLAAVHRRLLKTNPQAAAFMCIPPTTHSLMVSALGLLLVFRTNSAYQRFVEGRKIWGNIVNCSRDLYRYIMMYEKEIGVDKRRRVQRLLAAFPFLLRHRVRPNLVMHRVDDELVVRDPQNTLLLYQDRALLDNDPEAAAVANMEANTGTSRRKTRSLFWVDKRTCKCWDLHFPPSICTLYSTLSCNALTNPFQCRGACYRTELSSNALGHKIDHYGCVIAWHR